MTRKPEQPNYYFWLLNLVAIMLIGAGLTLSLRYGQTWIQSVWRACQTGLGHLADQMPLAWQLLIPLLGLIVIIRAGQSIIHQIRATRRLTRLFAPLRETLPTRVTPLLAARDLQPEDVVFLSLRAPHAFCLGLWRGHIWLTAGLVDLLSDEELAAVLDHEVHHLRRRDPLRLLISRALKSAFFFLPLARTLAMAAELHQEMAADQSAIRQAGDDLPLLCALQKLLTQNAAADVFSEVAYNPFNVTEARLRRLIGSSAPVRQRRPLAEWLINLSVMAVLSGSLLFSLGAGVEQPEINHCVAEAGQIAQTTLADSNLASYSFSK